jgi:hypothetical protein
MKYLVVTLTLLFFRLQPSFGQNLEVNQPIGFMSVNKKEIKKSKLLEDNLRFFINTKESDCQMQVYSDVTDIHSCGKITDVMFKKTYEGPDKTTVIYEYKFNWHFKNNYDSESGVAEVLYKEVVNMNIKDIRLQIESKKQSIYIRTIIDYSWKPINQPINASRQDR